MDILEELQELGIDIKEALERFMNNKDLYKRMLLKFPPNVEKLPVLSFIDAGDNATALANAHTLKGVAGNLSLTPLFKGYTEIVALFRADKPQEARKILVDLLPVQEQIISCINKYC